jgi:hypothetical protein
VVMLLALNMRLLMCCSCCFNKHGRLRRKKHSRLYVDSRLYVHLRSDVCDKKQCY